MNVKEQAKNGLKTFVFTFALTLVVLGAFSYLLSGLNSTDVAEDTSQSLGVTTNANDKDKDDNVDKDLVGDSSATDPFGDLLAQKPTVETPAVLAGSTEGDNAMPNDPVTITSGDLTSTDTPESTVPDTGVVSMTFGFISSILLLAMFAYILVINPRKYALAKFERRVLEDLD